MDNKKILITVTLTLCMLIFASAVLIHLEVWVKQQETRLQLMAIDVVMGAYADPEPRPDRGPAAKSPSGKEPY